MIAKSREEILQGAREFIGQWKQLGFENEYVAIQEWEQMMFKIARGGSIEMLHGIREQLEKEWTER